MAGRNGSGRSNLSLHSRFSTTGNVWIGVTDASISSFDVSSP
jgi:hypothetical protein